MILAGYGLDKLIAPAFGKGAYKEILQDISLSTDVQESFYNFIVNSYECQRYFVDWLREMKGLHQIYKQLEDANKACNDELKRLLAD